MAGVVGVIDYWLIQSFKNEFSQDETLIHRSKSYAANMVFWIRRFMGGEAALSIKPDMADSPEKLEMQGRLGGVLTLCEGVTPAL